MVKRKKNITQTEGAELTTVYYAWPTLKTGGHNCPSTYSYNTELKLANNKDKYTWKEM